MRYNCNMKITAIKTHKITTEDTDILKIIDQYVTTFEENSILVVTSKIISLCEGSIASSETNKDELVISQADKYLPKETNTFNLFVTIKDNILAVNAGVDESNSKDGYVLWPKNPFDSANKIRRFLQEKFKLQNVGVLITDSKTTPLRYGITGIGIAYSGFAAINDYVGTPDVFGRILKMTKVSVLDGLAAGAVVVMGEGNNQTPLSIISDIPFVEFQSADPTKEEIQSHNIEAETDVYGVMLQSAPWQKGKKA